MNTTFTVSVDLAKRKTSVTGLVAVGEKVNVVISGFGDYSVPEWEPDNTEGFSGAALRFRLVTPEGKDLVRFPLAEGDKWSGYGGEFSAEVDFNTMQLRKWLRGFPIDGKAEVGVIVDSVVDAMEYGRGTVKILQWAASPAEDPTILPDWRKTLRDLNAAIVDISSKTNRAETAAQAAQTARDDAQISKESAETAANNALSSENAAKGFKNNAESASARASASAEEAKASQTAAESAKSAAESARDEAIGAKDSAELAVSKTETALGKMTASARQVDGGVEVLLWNGQGNKPMPIFIPNGLDGVTGYVKCDDDNKYYRVKCKEVDGEKVLVLEQVGAEEVAKDSIVRCVNNVHPDDNGNVVIPLNYLPLAGGTLTGNIRIVKSSPWFVVKLTDAVRAEKPTERQYGGIDIKDKNDDRLGFITAAKEVSEDVTLQLYSYDPNQESGQYKSTMLSIISAKDGKNSRIEINAPLRQRGQFYSVIQGGRLTNGTSATFNTAFRDVNYIVLKIDGSAISGVTKTTTGFTVSAASTFNWIAIGAL